MKANYHTHTKLCGHAMGEYDDYVIDAICGGLEELGFSDHCPFPGDGFSERMTYAQLPEYVKTIESLKEKYRGRIKLYTGCEVEYYEVFRPYYEWLLGHGMEYLILGQHYAIMPDGSLRWLFHGRLGTEGLIAYTDNVISAMKTGYFSYVAHPDLFTISDLLKENETKRQIDRLLNEAVKHDWILELNANGIRKGKSWQRDGEFRYQYTTDEFWKEVGKAGVRTIIGADAHLPESVCDDAVRQSGDMAKRLGLRLTDRLVINETGRAQ